MTQSKEGPERRGSALRSNVEVTHRIAIKARQVAVGGFEIGYAGYARHIPLK